ncbi:MAG: hypothetical protein GF401_20970 [Chitinivibrionales bacterium]|nr:hypothetical protein [Chitinivibrionales bacterium]
METAAVMTDEVVHVLEVTIMLLLVILAGLLLRKKKLLDDCSTERLSVFVVDITFPALVFTSMLRTVDPQVLSRSWYLPLTGMVIFILGMGLGYLAAPLFKATGGPGRGSLAFAVGTPNWLFIPLPIAIALYGNQGQNIVLLVNVGALLIFWSVGVWIVRGGDPGSISLRRILLNPGLLATILGILIALAFPMTRTLEEADVTTIGFVPAALSVIVQAMAFIGDITVPLSMIVTGSLLAESGTRGAWNIRIILISAIRLLVIPAIVLLLIRLADLIGIHIPTAVGMTIIIISAMPVAITCSIVADKNDGDVELVSHTIFISTIASVVTVPVIVWFSFFAAGLP